jgi:septum formation protein
MRLILASASPRRVELLRAAGVAFDAMPVEVDERPHPGEPPERYVARLADAKASAVRCRVSGSLVLAADTAVVVDGQMLGKPENEEDAARMLRILSGRAHLVLTGLALQDTARALSHVESTLVHFLPLSESEVAWYVSTGEPCGKAGAYAVQGLASRFVTRIEGSYSNVVGLPIAAVYRLLREFGGVDGL